IAAIAKIAASARGTRIVLTAVPPNTDALTVLPVRNAGAELIDHAHHLMSWNTWVLNSRPRAFFRESVTAADATGLYLHPRVARARIRPLAATVWNSPPGLGIRATFIDVAVIGLTGGGRVAAIVIQSSHWAGLPLHNSGRSRAVPWRFS